MVLSGCSFDACRRHPVSMLSGAPSASRFGTLPPSIVDQFLWRCGQPLKAFINHVLLMLPLQPIRICRCNQRWGLGAPSCRVAARSACRPPVMPAGLFIRDVLRRQTSGSKNGGGGAEREVGEDSRSSSVLNLATFDDVFVFEFTATT